jgi:predicted Ser/Thr protein kinase
MELKFTVILNYDLTLKLNKSAINLKNVMNGKYEKQFEGLIGCANFGIVYKAMNRKDGKVYAIKKIAFNETDLNFYRELAVF